MYASFGRRGALAAAQDKRDKNVAGLLAGTLEVGNVFDNVEFHTELTAPQITFRHSTNLNYIQSFQFGQGADKIESKYPFPMEYERAGYPKLRVEGAGSSNCVRAGKLELDLDVEGEGFTFVFKALRKKGTEVELFRVEHDDAHTANSILTYVGHERVKALGKAILRKESKILEAEILEEIEEQMNAEGGELSEWQDEGEEGAMPEEEDLFPLGSTLNDDLPSWEESVKVLQRTGPCQGERQYLIEWVDSDFEHEWVPSSLARIKFPQKVLEFYEGLIRIPVPSQ